MELEFDHEEPLVESNVIGYLEGIADQIDRRLGSEPHSRELVGRSSRLASGMGLSLDERWLCVMAARFHDIGKVIIPDAVLMKPGPLTDEEWEVVHQHPEEGARILSRFPEFREIALVVWDHHERVDGTGYPRGKSKDEISLEARIVAVCDVWAALTVDRPYRAALSVADAWGELLAGSGTQFDPDVVREFLRVQLELESKDPADLVAPGESVSWF